jgi:hypothetical protein
MLNKLELLTVVILSAEFRRFSPHNQNVASRRNHPQPNTGEFKMKAIRHIIVILLGLSLYAPLTPARPAPDGLKKAQTTNKGAQDVLIVIQQEQVRFTAQGAVEEMRLQIVDQTGSLVYDSGAVTGPELTWVLKQADGEAVRSGLYAYTLSVKDAGAAEARTRRGHLIVDRARERDGKPDRLWITSQNESGVGTELTVARGEEETVAGTSATSAQQNLRTDGNTQIEESQPKNVSDAPSTITGGTVNRIAKFTSANDLGDSIITEQNGVIGVAGPMTSVRNTANEIMVQTTGATNAYAQFKATTRNQQWSWGTSQNYNGNQFYLADATYGHLRMTIQPNGGEVGFHSPESSHIVVRTAGGTNAWAQFRMQTASQQWAVGTSQNYNGNQFYLVDNNYQQLRMTVQPNGGAITFPLGNVGVGVPDPQAKLDVAGQTRTQSLQITGGADFAENFEVNETTNGEAVTMKIEPGMVVSIDAERPGKLTLSARPYDSQVAGVVSGAGGVKPGMVMSQEGTLADGNIPVALTGRVYCWVDASYGVIRPGDLLTTAPTPGHAMKAIDREKAQGAIIGKAMTSLNEGRGLVLILVNLQ